MPGEIGKRIERGSFIGREKWQRGEGTAFFLNKLWTVIYSLRHMSFDQIKNLKLLR